MASKTLHLSLLFLLCSSLILSLSGVVDSDDLGGDTGGDIGADTGFDFGGDVGGDSDVGQGAFSQKSIDGTGAGTSSPPSVPNGGGMTPKPVYFSCTLPIIFLAATLCYGVGPASVGCKF